MKKRLLEIFEKDNYQALTKEGLIQKLNLRDDERSELDAALNDLLSSFDIALSKKKRYILPRDLGIYKGSISVKNDEFGFITAEGFAVDFYVSTWGLNGAMDKDLVAFKYRENNDDWFKPEAEVIAVITRNLKTIVGEVVNKKGKFYLQTSLELDRGIKITNPDELTKEGDIVKVKINNHSTNPLEAEIVEKIGFKNDIGIDILSIASSFDFTPNFEEKTMLEVNAIDPDISEEIKARQKPSLENIFTIDGEDAKDLDDAVAIKKLENGNYLLGVYIADVSHYVLENTALDDEAYFRGTSVYLVNRVIPMLPQRLSNDLCSLNPDNEKLVIACEMEMNDQGEVVDSNIFPSFIKTKHRMTYTNVNKILDGDQEVMNKYHNIYSDIMIMRELQIILNQMREARGALDFDVNESKIIVNDKGIPVEIKLIHRGLSERMIEEFMLIANETVASTIFAFDLPFIYRIHDVPNNIKLNSFKEISKLVGYSSLKRKVNSRQLQTFLDSIHEEDNYLKTLLLRSMAKAIYSEENIGHYGLGSKCYTHFTSPIRRYPDLIVHRYLRKYLFHKEINANEFSALTKKIADIAEQSSKKERDAIECEYQVDDMKKAEYMSKHLGEKYEGVVSSVTKFGFFVTLDNTVDGLVHVNNLDQKYTYDSKLMALIGSNNSVFRLGDKVLVEVINSDKLTRKIDFKVISKKKNKLDAKDLNKPKERKDSFVKKPRNRSSEKFNQRNDGKRNSHGKSEHRRKKQKGKS